MTAPAQIDPLRWCWAIALAFGAVAGWRLGIPSKMYFDEVHYVPAARALLALSPANPEHPLVGKEAIAAAIWAFGDAPAVWRLPSAVMGTLGLFAFGRALWWATRRRFAALAGMVLLATNFTWMIQSRIAMLDMVMAGFCMTALWQLAFALRCAKPRRHLALAGLCLGLAMGAKWSVVPVVAVVCGAMVAASLRRPMRGIRLAELLLWLGAVPLAVYWASFGPAFFYHPNPLRAWDVVGWHRYMLQLQASVVKHHTYQSAWWQWAINERPIWYLYERVDGAQRGVLLLGNPFAMLAGLPALGWCLWSRRAVPLLIAACYAVSLGMWAVDGKPVQFYYHYLLPGAFLMAALALALDALWRQPKWWRWGAPLAVAVPAGMFVWFWPIIAATPLAGPGGFADWMWLPSWR